MTASATATAVPLGWVQLCFQKLDAYRCAIEFVALTVQIQAAIPRGHGDLRDQLRRAALSVPLNIAEGSGRATEADASRHFAMLGRLVAMLTKMSRLSPT